MKQQEAKYIALADWARTQIREHRVLFGEKFFTENTLCEMFGISRQTVRQALGILENEGYLERRRGSGTYVAWNGVSATEESRIIGVVITFSDDYIFPSIIRGIERVLSRNNYTMQLVFTHNRVENERRALLDMLDKNVDGILVEPTKAALPNPNLDLYRQLQSRDMPVVFFNAFYPGAPHPHVSLNDKEAGRVVTEHLIAHGHTCIAGLFQSDDLQGHLRYAGYLDALMHHNLPVRADCVLWYTTEDIPHLFIDDRQKVLDRLSGCTAVVCYNDYRATELLPFLVKQGIRVPEDISVVGVDDSPYSVLTKPPLTTVKHPKEELGKVAAQNLLEIIKDPSFEATVDFDARLVERGSVAQAPRG